MDKVISKDGTSIAFDKTGKGPALVLVDGAFCFREYGITPKLVPLISDFFTVYSYDRRGRGESSDKGPYSIDNEVEDLKGIIEKTGEVPFRKNESVANTLSYDVAIMGNYSIPEKIAASINVPTVVIGGEKSPQNLRNAVEAVAKAIPRSQIRMLKGSHNVSMKVLAPCLIDFFKQ